MTLDTRLVFAPPLDSQPHVDTPHNPTPKMAEHHTDNCGPSRYETMDEIELNAECKSMDRENQELRVKLKDKDKAIAASNQEVSALKEALAEKERELVSTKATAKVTAEQKRLYFRVVYSLLGLVKECNDGENAGSGAISCWVHEDEQWTGPWFPWAKNAVGFALEHGFGQVPRVGTEDHNTGTDTQMPDADSQPTATPTFVKQRLSTPAVPETPKTEIVLVPPVNTTLEPFTASNDPKSSQQNGDTSAADIRLTAKPLEDDDDIEEPLEEDDDIEEPLEDDDDIEEPLEDDDDIEEPLEDDDDIEEPLEDVKQWPWNHHPDPGPEPTPYDRYYGPHVALEDCEQWDFEDVSKFPTVKQLGVLSKNDKGEVYKDCNGETDWTSTVSACMNIDFTLPPKCWYVTTDGTRIYRWKTDSRTFSRTLPWFMSLPPHHLISRNKGQLRKYGPCFSCTGKSNAQGQKMNLDCFVFVCCSLCRQGRWKGLCFPHDFSYVGVQKKRDIQKISFPWHDSVQSTLKRVTKQESADEDQAEG